MELEKLISLVQEKVGKTDFSAQTIRKICELNPVEEGQEPDDAYFTRVTGLITTMQGQFNHDFAEKFSDAKKNLLTEDMFKKLSSEQLSAIEGWVKAIKGDDKGGDDSNELAELQKTVMALKDMMDNADKAKKQSEILNEVKAAMRKLRAEDEYVLEQTLKGRTFDETKSADELAKGLIGDYEDELKKCRGYGIPPMAGGGDGTDSQKSWMQQRFNANHGIKE